jgi:hypothetical protein
MYWVVASKTNFRSCYIYNLLRQLKTVVVVSSFIIIKKISRITDDVKTKKIRRDLLFAFLVWHRFVSSSLLLAAVLLLSHLEQLGILLNDVHENPVNVGAQLNVHVALVL